MKLELPTEKLHLLPVQLIETDEGVVVKRGRVEVKVTGEDAGEVVGAVLEAAINGATREQLAELFAPPERPAVEALVEHLMSRRILVSEDDWDIAGIGAESNLDIFYWHFGSQLKQVRERLNKCRVKVFGVNYISRQLIAGLRASGAERIEVADHPLLRNLALFDDEGRLNEDAWPEDLGAIQESNHQPEQLDPESVDCIIATSDTGGIEQLREWNEFCVLHKLYYLPVLLQDLVGYVGPLVIPGETACFECLRSRQNAHLTDHVNRRALEAAFLHEQAISGFHPSMASILGDIATLEMTKYFGLGESLAKVGTLIEVNLLGCEMKARRVLKLPRCEVCSSLNQTPSTLLTRTRLGLDQGGQG
jgi:thiazole/oxazole-forming peptide maturase SagC family component